MDVISYSYADKQKQRIEKFIENPDSVSGIVTVPSTIAVGETITIPAGRTAVLPNLAIEGTLVVDGDVFIPSGATLGDLDNQLALKAPLASPALTGTPTAPTAAVGTNTTRVATTAFVLANSVNTLGDLGLTATATELNYVDGVTSAIQTQLNAKAPLASPTFTGTVVLPSTTSIGTITNTELSYLDGVTSAIQTQINGKLSTTGKAADSDKLDGYDSSVFAKLASPALTGTPTAPTATAGTNTTQVATTAFATAHFDSKLRGYETNGRHAAIDNLNTAILNGTYNYNGSTAVGAPDSTWGFVTVYTHTYHDGWISQVANGMQNDKIWKRFSFDKGATWSAWKEMAPLASPALTGTPTAPTATAGTNTTQIATTAFVGTALGSALQDTAHSFTSNGYQKLSNGLIFQWGTASVAAYKTTITFPIAFPTDCVNVQVTQIRSSNTGGAYNYATSYTKTSFYLVGTNDSPEAWFAIGY